MDAKVTIIFYFALIGTALAHTDDFEQKYENFTKADFINEIRELNRIITMKDEKIAKKSRDLNSERYASQTLNEILLEKFKDLCKNNVSLITINCVTMPINIVFKYYYIREFHREFNDECLEERIPGDLTEQYRIFMSAAYLHNETSKCFNMSNFLISEINRFNITIESFTEKLRQFLPFYDKMIDEWYFATNRDEMAFLAWLTEKHPRIHDTIYLIFQKAHSSIRENGLCPYVHNMKKNTTINLSYKR